VELAVVMVLLAVMASITFPRFRYALLTDDLRTTTRSMVGMIQSLRAEAMREHKTLVLHFELESNRFWVHSSEMTEEERALAQSKARQLPEGIRVTDVWTHGEGKQMTGEAKILFSKKGYVQESAIHLRSDDGREYTLKLSTFVQKVHIHESYVDYRDT
jgi:Tfp pilus assembly protein FimT